MYMADRRKRLKIRFPKAPSFAPGDLIANLHTSWLAVRICTIPAQDTAIPVAPGSTAAVPPTAKFQLDDGDSCNDAVTHLDAYVLSTYAVAAIQYKPL